MCFFLYDIFGESNILTEIEISVIKKFFITEVSVHEQQHS